MFGVVIVLVAIALLFVLGSYAVYRLLKRMGSKETGDRRRF